jgi:hypothetical protein
MIFKPFEIVDMVLVSILLSRKVREQSVTCSLVVLGGGAIVCLPQLLHKPDHNTCKHVPHRGHRPAM